MQASSALRGIGRVGILAGVIAFAAPAAAAAPQDTTPTEIAASAAIESVTLYPGRASVTRVARPALKPGLWLLRFDDLPPTIQPDTLEARTSSGRVLAVDFSSRPTADRSGTPEAKALDAEIKTLESKIALNADAAAALESERKLIDMVTLRTGNDATKEGGTDKLDLAVLDTYSPALHRKAIASDMKFYDPLKKSLMRGLVNRFLKNGGTVPTRLRNFHIIDTYDRAAMNYTPRPYRGKLTVFKAEHSWGPNEMGWESLAKGGLEVRIVPGDHYTVIEEPNVGQLAKEIGGQLTELEAGLEALHA